MKQLLLSLMIAASAAVQAQVPDSTAGLTAPDTSAVIPDSSGRWTIAEDVPVRTAPAPARSTSRATPAPYSYSKTGKDVKLSNGKELSIDRITDPDGRKRWKRMNKKSRRKAPDSPPGTVPIVD